MFTSLAWLYDIAERRKSQPVYYKNIAQKNAVDFMQIDETDIIYIIVYNSWTTVKVYNAAARPYKPRSAVFGSRSKIIRQRKVFRYTYFIQFDYSLF